MSEWPAVTIFCDGNAQIGYGHIRRSLALAEQLATDRINVSIKGLSADAVKMLPKTQTDFPEPHTVIFDSPLDINNLLETARSARQTTVTLDWFGKSVPDINIAVFEHAPVRSVKATYIGFEYILIRREITALPMPLITGNTNKVLVCLGGGDLLRQGYETAFFLSEQGFTVTLVQGPLAKQTQHRTNFTSLVNPLNFPQLLSECDWTVTNGGGCFFEALYLGKPAVVLPQTVAEKKIADYAAERNALMGIGKEALLNIHSSDRFTIAQKGKELVDGGGAQRISAIIKKVT